MQRFVLSNSYLFQYSTIVAPFEKNDVARMKTTNNIERCVLAKIFHKNQKGSLGMILNEDN
jgi:hypothetical protein